MTHINIINIEEDSWGYITFEWDASTITSYGDYELTIDILYNGDYPTYSPLKSFTLSSLIGTIDLSRPGKPLPLGDEDVNIGAEISPYFKKPLQCSSIPFDIGLYVDGSNKPLNKNNLHLSCKENRIGFVVDLTSGVDTIALLGKMFKSKLKESTILQVPSLIRMEMKDPMKYW